MNTPSGVGALTGKCDERFKSCDRRFEEIHDAVFKDGEGGCKFDISGIRLTLKDYCSKFIKKKSFFTTLSFFVATIIVPCTIVILNVWADQRNLNDRLQKFATKEQYERLVVKVTRVEEQYHHVEKVLEYIKERQNANTKEILETIKKYK